MTYFEHAADALNTNRDFSVHIDAKDVPDRYERLQKAFIQKDRKDAAMSGEGREVTEEQELLGLIGEAREDEAVMKNERKEEVQERERKKIATGARLVEKASIDIDE